MRAFVIRGFNKKSDSKGQEIDFERVQTELITPALQACGLAGTTTGEVKDAGNIRADMFAMILEADLVICDITVHNANVFYELGIRHALRKKHTLLLKGDPSADSTPFDLSTDRYLKYPVASPKDAVPDLIEKIRASINSSRETDSPIFLMLPGLSQADPAQINLVPLELIEEIERADAAKDKGWLRVIAQDLRGQRYQWEGLRRVARKQWIRQDFAGARDSWDAIRKAMPDDVEACLALANVYERQYRSDKREALLESSNQMIDRVLDNESATRGQRAEALALEGRNFKTLWRQRFAGQNEVQQVLPLALDMKALQSYEAYRKAFDHDLNAFYPGLAALQMGYVLQRLATLPGWRTPFKGKDRDAQRRREDLEDELPALHQVVAASIRRALAHAKADDLKWAQIADADLLYLQQSEDASDEDLASLVQAYTDAIPGGDRFALDATGGQIALFAQLGLRARAAAAVLKALGSPSAAGQSQQQEHLVVFAGHNFDAPGAPRRFPETAEAAARAQIEQKLLALKTALPPGRQLTVLASAARGADLLAHELCASLAIPSRLCLPMPAEDVSRLAFAEGDAWRRRFLDLAQLHEARTLQMADSAELPRWLATREEIDVWERGNRWVMALADAWGASQLTLLVLWDKFDDGRTGGTAHMVRLARSAPDFEIEEIDSRQFLG